MELPQPMLPKSTRTNSLGGLQKAGWLIILFWGISEARALLVPLCISALLAFLIVPVVLALRKRKIPESVAIGCAALILLLPFLGIGATLIQQGQRLVRDYPTISQSLSRSITQFASSPIGEKLGLSSISLDTGELVQKLTSQAGQGIAFVIGGLSLLMDMGSQTLLILIFAILMVSSRDHLEKSTTRILEQFESLESETLLIEVTSLIQKFLVARIVIVAIVAAVDAIALRAFGIPYSFLLGAAFGVLTLVPAVGFLIALVPSLIVAFATGHSFVSVVILTAVLIVVSFIEGNILSPKMVGGKLNLNALATFVGLFAGGLLWGIWGMLLSVPALGVIRIVFSATPSLQPWGDLLAEKEDHQLRLSLIRKRKVPTPGSPSEGLARSRFEQVQQTRPVTKN